MINLLPPKEKKELADKKNERIIMIFGYIILVSLICLISIIASIKFLVLGKLVSQKYDSLQIQNNNSVDVLAYKKKLQEINKKMLDVESFYENKIYFTNSLKVMSEISKPEGIYFTNADFSKAKEAGQLLVSISGFSDTRDNLIILKNNIEKDLRISNLNFSSGSWVKTKNINFYLDFKTKSTTESNEK